MKKIIFSLLAVLTVAAVDAQVRNGNMITERTKFGVKGGLSTSSQTLEQYGIGITTDDTKPGIVAGVEAEIPVKNGWYIQPEINYANMGAKSFQQFNDSKTGASRTGLIKYANNYVQVPVLVKFRPLYSGFGVYFGPQLGVLAQSREIPPAEYSPVTTTDDYTRAEFAGVAGVEYYFPSSDDRAPRFGLSARYIHGFSNLFKDNPGVRPDGTSALSASQGRLTNSGFQLTLGVRF